MNSSEHSAQLRQLLAAVSLSARSHRHQFRKDGQTPYFAHPVRVAFIITQYFGIHDPACLQVALLHDTIEDTTTDRDDLTIFPPQVGVAVAALTKDKRMLEPEREDAYRAAIVQGDAITQIVKLADLVDNLLDSVHLPWAAREKTCRSGRDLLTALDGHLQPDARSAFNIVLHLLGECENDLRTAPDAPHNA